jgi:hypothetical protein
MPVSEQCTPMSDKRKIPEVSEQWRGIPEVAVLADGQQSLQFRPLEHFGNRFFLNGITPIKQM